MGFDKVWIIGDAHLLALLRRGLETLKDGDAFSNQQKKKLLFMPENFEVIIGSFHYSWSFTTQIRGGLNTILGTRWRLPNYLYIFFSNDQVDDADILGDQVYPLLDKLFSYINRRLTERKVVLPKKARRYKPPIVTVVKTLPKAIDRLNENNFKIRRRTFNRALQKSALNFKWRAINIDTILPTTHSIFDDKGEDLSDLGLQCLWEFISEDLATMEYPQTSSTKKF